MSAINVSHLAKSYAGVAAVVDVSFTVGDAEIVAILGPNGAGKTTTLEILEGYRRRSGGEVSVLGLDPARAGRSWRAGLGMVLQATTLDEQLTVSETLALYGTFYPNRRSVEESLDLVDLRRSGGKRVGALSGGQRRRLDLAVGVVGQPRLLFLDEPTTGFDPEARHRCWDVIERLRGQGMAVLLTTHYMEEASRLADRIVVIAQGRVVADGTQEELTTVRYQESVIDLPLRVDIAHLPTTLRPMAAREGDVARLRTTDLSRVLGALTDWSRATGTDLSGLTVARPSLEDVYLDMIKEVRHAT